MLSLTQLQIAAYVILSFLVLIVVLGLLNVLYSILMCLTENDQTIDVNLSV
jgi:ABC-type lipoprotein release transport system permease subunit